MIRSSKEIARLVYLCGLLASKAKADGKVLASRSQSKERSLPLSELQPKPRQINRGLSVAWVIKVYAQNS